MSTAREKAQALRSEVLRQLEKVGTATTSDLFFLVKPKNKTMKAFANVLTYMRIAGLVKNVEKQSVQAVWEIAEQIEEEEEPVDEDRQCMYPRYCLSPVALPRKNDMRHTTYKPEPWAPPRG
jgi:hypothetical protein